jgi:hypothetical protein
MVVSSPEEEWEPRPVQQTNSGPGTFVAGHNFGHIGTIDAKTKAVLEKVAKQAPGLARLLDRALRDGVISPDLAISLSAAARNINEEVAISLWEASRRLNHDVAESLNLSSQKLNSEVANEISVSVDALQQLPEQLRLATAELRTVAQEIRDLADAVLRLGTLEGSTNALLGASENLAMASSRVVPQEKRGRFLWGVLLGVILVVLALAFYAFGTKGA